MKTRRVVVSPNTFLVEPYAPGLTIDFREPADMTDLEKLRRSFDLQQLSGTGADSEVPRRLGRILVSLGITEDETDFAASLEAFTGERQLKPQLVACLRALGVPEPPEEVSECVALLFGKTGCLDRNVHHPLRLFCHPPGEVTRLEEGSTHYGYVLEGECVVTERGRTVVVGANTFFCVAGAAHLEGTGKCVVTTRFQYKGLTLFGGEVEDWGRLQYIDGCTDTLLVAPVKRGEPCLNALYFPPATRQTRHVHPSVRCGAVISGEGVCETPSGDHPLKKGSIFFLPPETYHAFHTRDVPGAGRSALTVLAFHPDSDFGPTDAHHPMINRTYFRFLHRLRSAATAA
jgi:quercetin dioxygenase-like cupin family protein